MSFKNINSLIFETDKIVGSFLLKDPPKKKTILYWFFKSTVPRNILLWQGLALTTLISTKFKLISVIFCASVEAVFIAEYTSLANTVLNKKQIINLLTWCEELYDVEKKFHRLVQKLAGTHMMSLEKEATKVLKWFRIVMYANWFTMTFGFLGLQIVLPESILPKFTPITPFCLLFKDQDNWTAFLTTMFVQTFILFDAFSIAIYVFGIVLTIIIHVLGYLDLIKETIQLMGREILSRSHFFVETASKSKLQLETKSINDELSSKNEMNFDKWMKILTEMISDVNSIISILSNIYSMTFLLVEIATLACFFTSGLTFTILRQQYLFAAGINVGGFLLWIFCYINEKILDKIDDIEAAFYDIPWYELDTKQQKMMLIAMNCDKIQRGFTAAGIHNLTIERFGIVIKAGYTNVLVLKDLVQK